MAQDTGLAACAMRNMIRGSAIWGTIIWIPALGLTAILIATGLWAGPVIAAAVNMLAACLFAGLIAVQWHRFEMLQEMPVSISFTAKGALWCYAWRWLLFWAVTFIPALYVMAQFSGAPEWTALQMDRGISLPAFGVALFVACVSVLALGLTMPSTASRYEKISLRNSFLRTRHVLPGILSMSLVIAVIMSVAVGVTTPLAGSAVMGAVRATALLTLFLMLETVTLSEIYRRVGPSHFPVKGRPLII